MRPDLELHVIGPFKASPRPTAFVVASLLVVQFLCGCRDRVAGGGRPGNEVAVFAAASLREAVTEVAQRFEQVHGTQVVLNFAGSNTLAEQIRAAPHKANVFISADEQWMDVLEDAKLLVPGSRQSLLSNELVIIAHRNAALKAFQNPRELCQPSITHLVLAHPAAVPAGRYARQYLADIDVDGRSLWSLLEARVVPALDVRSSLAMVETDPRMVGVVYRTDIGASNHVRVLYAVPRAQAPPISYAMAEIKNGAETDLAQKLREFLVGSHSREVFEKHGFTALP